MDPLELLWQTVGLPVAACAVAWALGRFGFPSRPRVRGALAALGLAVGFCATLFTSGRRPSLPLGPSEDAWTWVFWFAPAGVILGIAGRFLPASESLRFPTRWLAATAAARLLLQGLVPHALTERDALFRAVAAGAVAAGVWTAASVQARRAVLAPPRTGPPPLFAAIPLIAALAGAAVIVLQWSHNVAMAQGLGALAAGVSTTALLAWRRGNPALPASAAPVMVLAFVGILLGAHAYLNYGSVVRFPWQTGVLLAAAAACVAIPKPWWLGAALSLALVGGALALAETLGTTAPAASPFYDPSS